MNPMINKKIKFNHIQLLFILLLIIFNLFCNGCSNKIKINRVGILVDGHSFDDMIKGFKIKMTELGYIENKNIIYYLENGKGEIQQKINVLLRNM